MYLRVVAAFLFCAILLWGLFLYGATEPQTYYRLFLFSLLPGLIAIFLPLKRSHIGLLFVGLALLAQVALRGTLTGRGYVVVSLGWLSLFITLAVAAEKRRAAGGLLYFLIFAGALEALYGLIQALGEVDYIGSYYRGLGPIATGTLINRNHFAGLLNMTLPLAVGGLFSNFARRGSRARLRSEVYAWAWIILLSCSFMGLATFLSRSRGGVMVMVSSIAFIGLLLALKRGSARQMRLSGRAASILLLAILGLSLIVGVDAFLSRFEMVSSDEETRASVYRESIKLIAEHPFLGVGPRMFEWRFRPYQSRDAELLFDYAHNDYLQSAAEWGIPLALVFWGFVVWRLYRAMHIFFRSRDPWKQGTALGCSAAIFPILLHSFVDFNLQIPANLMIFAMIVGIAWSLEYTSVSGAPKRQQESNASVTGVNVVAGL